MSTVIKFDRYTRPTYSPEANEMLSILEGWYEQAKRGNDLLALMVMRVADGQVVTPEDAKALLTRVGVNPNFFAESSEHQATFWAERCDHEMREIEEWRAELHKPKGEGV